MRFVQLSEKIVQLQFESQRIMGETLLRFQEYYEGQEFRGEIFTLGEFRQWYSRHFGAFTYYDDTAGFNFPSTALRPFFEGLFDPLTLEETKILELFKSRSESFYVIGTYVDITGSQDDIDHEIAHALYFTSRGYKAAVEKVLDRVNIQKTLDGIVTGLQYHTEVAYDEAHAYMATGPDVLEQQKIWYPKDVAEDLKKIFVRYKRKLRGGKYA